MKKEYVIGLFALLILVQIAVPVSMIAQREATLKNGTAFRFKTAPVDPYDAFRGRYVAIRVDVAKVGYQGRLNYGQKVFALLDVDGNGFAQVSGVSLQKPAGVAYLKATAYPVGNKEVRIDLPIDRYYMEEKAAPRAEALYRQHSRRDKQDAYVTVRIRDGFAVVDGLYINDQKIETLLKQQK